MWPLNWLSYVGSNFFFKFLFLVILRGYAYPESGIEAVMFCMGSVQRCFRGAHWLHLQGKRVSCASEQQTGSYLFAQEAAWYLYQPHSIASHKLVLFLEPNPIIEDRCVCSRVRGSSVMGHETGASCDMDASDTWSQHLEEIGDRLNQQDGDRMGFLRMVNRNHVFNCSNYSLSSLFRYIDHLRPISVTLSSMSAQAVRTVLKLQKWVKLSA
jgi:hypothetical protein